MGIQLSNNRPNDQEGEGRLDLPFDRPWKPASASSGVAALPFELPSGLAGSIRLLAKTEQVSEASIYLTGLGILLSRYSGACDLTLSAVLLTPGSAPAFSKRSYTGVGHFVSSHYAPEATVRELLHSVDQSLTDDGSVLGPEASREKKLPSHAGFVWQDKGLLLPENADADAPSETGSDLPPSGHGDLSWMVCNDTAAIKTTLFYRSDLFDQSSAARILRHLVCVLDSMTMTADASLASLDFLPGDERATILKSYVGESADYPRVSLPELFCEQVRLRPDAEAVVYGSERLTYAELDRHSNQIAHFLLEEGLTPGDRVGIFMDRSVAMVASMLGILKAGGVYVSIDPDYPAERVRFVIEDTSMRLVLTQSDVSAALPSVAASVVIDAEDSPVFTSSSEPVSLPLDPESIAVLVYTSGSTGTPKGACIPHRAVVRTVRNTNYLQVLPQDRVAQSTSPSFDAAIKEIWLALANGATLVGVPRETLLGASELKRLIRSERITVLVVNTAYIHQIGLESPEALEGVRKVIFGGEAADPGPLRRLLKHLGSGVLVNGYGPAEGCVISTFHQINDIPEGVDDIPIGRPVTNARVYLLDDQQRLVPIGVTGEIYIGGDGVARGYLNRPELNRERFLPDTLSGIPGAVLYRTGDLARMLPDGALEFRGRRDEQVKIRGHRIELAEVRQAITTHPDVKQVFLRVSEQQAGDKRLISYVTLHRKLADAETILGQHTRNKLPDHMLPAAFVVLDSIPLTPNGKVDWKALPVPDDRPNLADAYLPPTTELEKSLVEAWQDALNVARVGINDNFFDLGGHSLLAARLIARIEKATSHNIPVATLFEAPTVAQLAQKLEQGSYASAWSPCVTLQTAKENTGAEPLFYVHSLGANLVSFRKIASLMRGDRTVYGLQPHGLNGDQAPLDRIEDMAAAYIAEIRKKQPQGPYYLGGVCLGGVIAYEMAQQLKRAGETIGAVVMIDSFLPGQLHFLRTRSSIMEYLDRHLGEILILPRLARLKYFTRWLANGVVRFGRASGVYERSSIARATRALRIAHIRAILTYQPQPYDGRVINMICAEAAHRAYEDRRLAWSSLVQGGFEIKMLPGNHLTMVEEPHVRVLVQELENCLDRASPSTRSKKQQGFRNTVRRRLSA